MRKLLAVLAHPDDESLGFGGTLAKYAAEGVETYLITATCGEAGRFGTLGKGHDPNEVARVREAELRSAAQVLGIHEVSILGYADGRVDQVPARTAIDEIGAHIRRIQPDVVLSFGPDGAYGHPDHIAISQFTTAAIIESGNVPKSYYLAWRAEKWNAYESAFGKLTSTVDGVQRQATPWPDWAVTTVIDTSSHWPTVWKAVSCHQTQMAIYEQLTRLDEAGQAALWGSQEFYRVHSSVNGGRKRETCLFDGLV